MCVFDDILKAPAVYLTNIYYTWHMSVHWCVRGRRWFDNYLPQDVCILAFLKKISPGSGYCMNNVIDWKTVHWTCQHPKESFRCSNLITILPKQVQTMLRQLLGTSANRGCINPSSAVLIMSVWSQCFIFVLFDPLGNYKKTFHAFADILAEHNRLLLDDFAWLYTSMLRQITPQTCFYSY